MLRKISFLIMLQALLIGGPMVLRAEVPQLINYQGVLLDKNDRPVTGESYDMVFSIYDSPTDPTPIWTSGTQSVPVKNGVYTYLLGSNSPLPNDLFATDTIRWLGITVGTDPEIDPRFRLTTTPYAYKALRADTANVALTSVGGAGGWIDDGDVVKLANPEDNIGIGISFPQARLHIIQDESGTEDLLRAEADIYMGGRLPALVLKRDARMGINTANPLTFLHIKSNELSLGAPAIEDECLLLEGTRASMGIYCQPDGPDGAAISLGQIFGGALVDKWSLVREKSAVDSGGGGLRFTYGALADPFGNNTKLRINTGGNIAMGRLDPGDHRLYVESYGSGVGGATAFISNTNPDGIGLFVENESPGLTMIVSQKGEWPNGEIFRCDSWTGNWHPVFRVMNSGRVICGELELTGGADIAEPFEISGEQDITPGAVVIIDDENPGKLKLSSFAYDTRVAGIVSGAGGVKPGLMLTQEAYFPGGRHIAISGRVYCQVDASYGAIKPGDLLTTSPTPGHAMKASDHSKAYGTVIGKAMTALADGQGLVLVLVNLQ